MPNPKFIIVKEVGKGEKLLPTHRLRSATQNKPNTIELHLEGEGNITIEGTLKSLAETIHSAFGG